MTQLRKSRSINRRRTQTGEIQILKLLKKFVSTKYQIKERGRNWK